MWANAKAVAEDVQREELIAAIPDSVKEDFWKAYKAVQAAKEA